jgi:hypothetical protein
MSKTFRTIAHSLTQAFVVVTMIAS